MSSRPEKVSCFPLLSAPPKTMTKTKTHTKTKTNTKTTRFFVDKETRKKKIQRERHLVPGLNVKVRWLKTQGEGFLFPFSLKRQMLSKNHLKTEDSRPENVLNSFFPEMANAVFRQICIAVIFIVFKHSRFRKVFQI